MIPEQPTPTSIPSPTDEGAKRTAGRNLAAAIVTGLALAGSLISTLYLSKLGFFLLASSAILLAQAEFYGAVRKAGYDAARFIGLVVGALVLAGAYHRGLPGIAFAIAVSLPATGLWIAADPERTRQAARGFGMTIFGILWVPFLGSHVILLSLLPDGGEIALVVVGLTAFYDIGAYAAGYRFGKTPIAPTVSPKKSIEGAIGGTLLVCVLALVVAPNMIDLSSGWLLILAIAISVVAPIGDLSESLVKRDLGIKDMGTILPGHGGMLDRIDALLLSVTVSYWIILGATG